MNAPHHHGFPNLPGKHALPGLIHPAEHAAYVRAHRGATSLDHTSGTILTYQDALVRHALDTYDIQPLKGWVSGNLHLLHSRNGTIALCSGFGHGAPAAGLVLEQLISLGTRKVITVGTAAALGPDLSPGAVVVCRRAIRDEGLSHHYSPPGTYALASAQLTSQLTRTLEPMQVAIHQGATWTIDALYRETAAEVGQYAAEGVLTVDMEAAGIFAVARHRHIQAAAAFSVADSLSHRTPRTDSRPTRDGLRLLLDAAIRTLISPAATSQQPAGGPG